LNNPSSRRNRSSRSADSFTTLHSIEMSRKYEPELVWRFGLYFRSSTSTIHPSSHSNIKHTSRGSTTPTAPFATRLDGSSTPSRFRSRSDRRSFDMAVPFQSGRVDSLDEYECYRQSPIQGSTKESHKSSTFVLPSHASSSTSSSASSPFSPYPPPPPPQAKSVDIPRNTHNNRKTGNPPRPPNAWICYRSARVH